jgi:hypothetical protein
MRGHARRRAAAAADTALVPLIREPRRRPMEIETQSFQMQTNLSQIIV